MKIAIVRRECGLGFGGAERYCANVSLGLLGAGHDVTVVADRSTVTNAGFFRARVFGRGSILKNLSFFYSTKRALEKADFDCIYALSRIEGADFLRISDPLHMAWLKLGYGKRLLPFKIRRLMPRHVSILYQERRAIENARFLITNSNLVKEQLSNYYRISKERIFTIYNGVDLDRFRPASGDERARTRAALGIADDECAIIFAGSDYRRKGLFCLMKALSSLKDTYPFRLLLLGVKPRKEIIKAAKGLSLVNRLSFLGYRSDAERYYRTGDILCLPTLYDPFANVCLEAMACGIPVITTYTNGASEITGRLGKWSVVPSSDVMALKKALSVFFEMDGSEQRILGSKAARIAQAFSWQNHIEQLLNLWEQKAKKVYQVPIFS